MGTNNLDEIIGKLETEKNAYIEEVKTTEPSKIVRRRRKSKKAENSITSVQELLDTIDNGEMEEKSIKRTSIALDHKDRLIISMLNINPKDLLRLLLDDFYKKPEIQKFINQTLKAKK